jgi:hypothetical protein
MDNQFEKKLLDKIKDEKIRPIPRWHFLLKNYVVWLVGSLSLFIGAAAVSVMIYLYRGDDLTSYLRTGGLKEFLLLALPYFWIIILILFTFLVYYQIKHTKKGYRYPAYAVIAFSIAASILLGGILFKAGLSKAIDDILGENAPYYETLFNRRMLFWYSPEDGRLSGMIIEYVPEDRYLLLDPKRKQWLVDASGLRNCCLGIRVNELANFTGEAVSDNEFRATEFFPMHSGKRYFMRRHGGMCRERGACMEGMEW